MNGMTHSEILEYATLLDQQSTDSIMTVSILRHRKAKFVWQAYEEFRNPMCTMAHQETNARIGSLGGERDGLLNMGEGIDFG